MKTAAIYARVSTADQIKGTSLSTQVDDCKKYAEEQGFVVTKVMQEDASGARLARPKLTEIRDMAERGEIQAVIVFEQDRLSRSLAHTMLLVEEFERERVELVFVNEPKNVTPEGKMLFGMKGLFKEYERSKIMERSRRGKERRAREGRVLASWTTPLGYSFVAGEGRFEVIPAEAHIVRSIFDWYVNEGRSLRAIAALLDNMGVPTKRGAARWCATTIRSILHNETYGGTWYYNKNEAVVAKKRRFVDGPLPRHEKSGHLVRPKEEWIGVQVPCIVPVEIYERVQEQMIKNARHQKRNCKTEYLLRGLLMCKQCGRRLTARPAYNANKTTQYYCTGKYDPQLKEACKCPWPNSVKLDARVWEKITAIMSDEEQIEQILKDHAQNHQGDRAHADAEAASIYTSIQALKTEENRFMDAYAQGVIDVEQLQERMTAIRKQKNTLQQMHGELLERIRQQETVQAQQETIKRHVALARKGLPVLLFDDRRAFLEAINFQGVIDGETDTMLITGYIRGMLSGISGKGKGATPDLSTYYKRPL